MFKKYLMLCFSIPLFFACNTKQIETTSTTAIPVSYTTNSTFTTNVYTITNADLIRSDQFSNIAIPYEYSNVTVYTAITNFLTNDAIASSITNTSDTTNYGASISGVTNLNNYMVLVTQSTNYNYYVSAYELTFYEYDSYCDSEGLAKVADIKARMNYPIGGISWWEASAYCNYLSAQAGLPLAYATNGNTNTAEYLDSSGNITTNLSEVKGFRILTTDEWQFAANGGELSVGYTFSGSDTLQSVSWNKLNSGKVPHPVGGLQPNELGIFDMSGNLWEITTGEGCLNRMGGSYKNREIANIGAHNPNNISSKNPTLSEKCTGKTFRIGFTE